MPAPRLAKSTTNLPEGSASGVVNEFKLELVCEDQQVDELVAIIGRAARTGQAEAG